MLTSATDCSTGGRKAIHRVTCHASCAGNMQATNADAAALGATRTPPSQNCDLVPIPTIQSNWDTDRGTGADRSMHT
jgi:hypothetical protein